MRQALLCVLCSIATLTFALSALAQPLVDVGFSARISKLDEREDDPYTAKLRINDLCYGYLTYDPATPGIQSGPDETRIYDIKGSGQSRIGIRIGELNLDFHSINSEIQDFEFFASSQTEENDSCALRFVFDRTSGQNPANLSIEKIELQFASPECETEVAENSLPSKLQHPNWPLRTIVIQYWRDGELFNLEAKIGTMTATAENRGAIRGNVFADLNSNCTVDPSEIKFRQRIIEFTPGPHYTSSDENGEFVAYLPLGNYEARLLGRPYWQTECVEQVQGFTLISVLQDEFVHYPLRALRPIQALDITILADRARPGFETVYSIHAENIGTIPYSGLIRFDPDDLFVDFSSQPAADLFNDGIAEWSIEDLAVGSTNKILVSLKVPADEALLGLQLCSKVETQSAFAGTEISPEQAQATECTEVRGAYDPNDMQVFAGLRNADGPISPDTKKLTYLIRFQNLGNAEAYRIRINSQLNSQLVGRTFSMVSSSHACEISIGENGELTWLFEDINLPAKVQDRAASQGFVKYEVELLDDLPLGSKIRNDAAIYFDFNKPIYTNEVVSRIEETPDSPVHSPATDNFLIFPNPSMGNFTIQMQEPQTIQMVLRNHLGQVLLQKDFDTSNSDLDVRHLPVGAYYLTITSTLGSMVKPLIIAR